MTEVFSFLFKVSVSDLSSSNNYSSEGRGFESRCGQKFFRKAKFPMKTFSIELGLKDQLVGGLEAHKMFSFNTKQKK